MILSPIAGINRVTQIFGVRPEVYKQFGLKGHNGIDLTGKDKLIMETLYSPFEGIVWEVGDQGDKGYGKYVRIRTQALDKEGRYKEVILGHMSVQSVKRGQLIGMLEPVGVEGNTGFSTGAHLHFGLRFLDKNKKVLNENNGFAGYIDQMPYLRFWTFPPQTEAYPIII